MELRVLSSIGILCGRRAATPVLLSAPKACFSEVLQLTLCDVPFGDAGGAGAQNYRLGTERRQDSAHHALALRDKFLLMRRPLCHRAKALTTTR
ncbi:hypothetical protein NDU88_007071 [Pleurodeles waltl]|uniref:Secreted protein n=1 Tax=Pleurodeles waltl TaxID=8319 RepID=A0AAV7TYY4_PLEWA|nr:hypothetical protein NDU88_007071 [Pleurodeles waltl]